MLIDGKQGDWSRQGEEGGMVPLRFKKTCKVYDMTDDGQTKGK